MTSPSPAVSRIDDGADPFDVLTVTVPGAPRTVLFSSGRGGDPARHLPLLRSLGEAGCSVVAPRFDMLASPRPTEGEILSRMRRLAHATTHASRGATIIGIGHSIGATILLGLAGADMLMRPGYALPRAVTLTFERLLLLAPATDFFRGPGALDEVTTPMTVWVGGKDRITPPAQAALLQEALRPGVAVEIVTHATADHFSFMHDLPPHIDDGHPDREGFLADLTDEIVQRAAL